MELTEECFICISNIDRPGYNENCKQCISNDIERQHKQIIKSGLLS